MLILSDNSMLILDGTQHLGEEPEDGEEEQRALLRFGTHRDPALIARLVRYNLITPEHANWKAGHRAAVAFRRRTGHLAVPYEHRELMPNGHSFRCCQVEWRVSGLG